MIFISSVRTYATSILVINSNFNPISRRFRNMASYSLKLFIENWGQTAADEDMVTIDSL